MNEAYSLEEALNSLEFAEKYGEKMQEGLKNIAFDVFTQIPKSMADCDFNIELSGSDTMPIICITADSIPIARVDTRDENNITAVMYESVMDEMDIMIDSQKIGKEELGEELNPYKPPLPSLPPEPVANVDAKEFEGIKYERYNRAENEKSMDDVDNIYNNVNKTLKSVGIKEPKQPNLFIVRKENLREAKDLKQELNTLRDELRHEVETARQNGANPMSVENVESKAKKILYKTQEYIITKNRIPPLTECIKDTMDKTVIQPVKEALGKAKAALDLKIESGKDALGQMRDTVKEANDKFMEDVLVGKDSVVTINEEKINSIHRSFLARNYAIDKSVEKSLNKCIDKLEKTFEKQAEIKGAVKDLGRAITGKERTGERPDLTNSQNKTLDTLNNIRSYFIKDSISLRREYNISKEISKANLEGAKELRSGAGKDTKSFDEKLKEVKARSIDNHNKNPKKVEGPNRSDDAR